jgi:hypothetical protein
MKISLILSIWTFDKRLNFVDLDGLIGAVLENLRREVALSQSWRDFPCSMITGAIQKCPGKRRPEVAVQCNGLDKTSIAASSRWARKIDFWG